MAGLTGMAAGSRNQALDGLKRSADLKEARENTGMQMEAAHRTMQISSTMSGVGGGAMIGAMAGGVPGAVIGGIIGGVAGLGASLFG